MPDKGESINAFRELINRYKKDFVRKLETNTENKQDLENLNRIIIRGCDDLYRRLAAFIELGVRGHPPPDKSQPFEYGFYSMGGLDYVWAEKDASDFLCYLRTDLRDAPYTLNTDIIDRTPGGVACKQ